MDPLVAQIVTAFLPNAGVHVEKLDKATDDYRNAKLIEARFTHGVQALRTVVPSERIQALGAYAWEVFHHRHVVLALGPPVASLTFAAMGRPDALQGILLAPHAWIAMTQEDPMMQLGAIVMCSSQAIDFYNSRILSDGREIVTARAISYETEYLRALGPALKPNEYQAQAMAKYPTFDPSLDYERKPVVPPN